MPCATSCVPSIRESTSMVGCDVRIEVASEAGACFGVDRALKLALRAAEEASGPVHTLGPLIHNPSVVADLDRRGVSVVDGPQVAAGDTLLLRTHGVPPQVEEAAHQAGAIVVDATCPFVKKCHRAAEELAAEGRQVLIVGEAGHPEVEGTLGHVPEAVVVGGADELDAIQLKRRVGLVVQTTLARDTLRAVVTSLVGRVEDLRVVDTICEATTRRQQAAAELAARADVMVVVGGLNSANTTHLAQICGTYCDRTFHIEEACDLRREWIEGASLIGITAGASTPQTEIDIVRDAIGAFVRER